MNTKYEVISENIKRGSPVLVVIDQSTATVLQEARDVDYLLKCFGWQYYIPSKKIAEPVHESLLIKTPLFGSTLRGYKKSKPLDFLGSFMPIELAPDAIEFCVMLLDKRNGDILSHKDLQDYSEGLSPDDVVRSLKDGRSIVALVDEDGVDVVDGVDDLIELAEQSYEADQIYIDGKDASAVSRLEFYAGVVIERSGGELVDVNQSLLRKKGNVTRNEVPVRFRR